MKTRSKKVAVIGAGVAGLVAAKHLTEENSGFECCVFERADSVGGTWVYTDQAGEDKYGLPIHSSMYQNLRTNLPKEIMQLPDFPHEKPKDRSYLTSDEVLQYFKDFAQHFDLCKYIKFQHIVKQISPTKEGGWKIKVTNLENSCNYLYHFDAVMVCVGMYSTPNYPAIKGTDEFKGFQMHSHNYRRPISFTKLTVLVIGCGPSGLDIVFQVSAHAKEVILSHHSTNLSNMKFPANVIQKPDVKKMGDFTVFFQDETSCDVDTIIYCTGYRKSYPFLSKKCGIMVNDSIVEPLYHHFININYPSMCFIGIPRELPGFSMFDAQVRCFINTLNGSASLPPKEDMMADTVKEYDERKRNGETRKQFHMMRKRYAKQYFDKLAELGKIESIKPVIVDIYFDGIGRMLKEFTSFRQMRYTLIDSKNYTAE